MKIDPPDTWDVANHTREGTSKLLVITKIIKHHVPSNFRSIAADEPFPKWEPRATATTNLAWDEHGDLATNMPSDAQVRALYDRKKAAIDATPGSTPVPLEGASDEEPMLPLDTALVGFRRPCKVIVMLQYTKYLPYFTKVSR